MTPKRSPSEQLSRTTVLLVDDDDVDREAAARAFARRGASDSLYLAESGAQALAMLRDSALMPMRPTLVLLDVRMPQMSGLEVLAELRKDPRLSSLQVIMTTVSSLESDMKAAFALGAKSYIVKPAEYEKFADLVLDAAEPAP